MRQFNLFAIFIILVFCLSCREQQQNKRTAIAVRTYFSEIWKGNYDKAENLIYNPIGLPDVEGFPICDDTILEKKKVLENQLALKEQHQYFLKKYPKVPDITIIDASEVYLGFNNNKLMTGTIHCKVELKNNSLTDTIYLQLFNSLNSKQAIIAEVQFKPPLSKYDIQKICR